MHAVQNVYEKDYDKYIELFLFLFKDIKSYNYVSSV